MGKRLEEIGISFGGIIRAMLTDAALLMGVPLNKLDVLVAFCNLWWLSPAVHSLRGIHSPTRKPCSRMSTTTPCYIPKNEDADQVCIFINKSANLNFLCLGKAVLPSTQGSPILPLWCGCTCKEVLARDKDILCSWRDSVWYTSNRKNEPIHSQG